MKWKKYAWKIGWTVIITLDSWMLGNFFFIGWDSISEQASVYTPDQQDSLRHVITNLTPDRLAQLRNLYQETYGVVSNVSDSTMTGNQDRDNKITFLTASHKLSQKLETVSQVMAYQSADSVVFHHDTVTIPENLAEDFYYTGASTLPGISQINMHHFYYGGDRKDLANTASLLNKKKRLAVIHEIGHVFNHRYISHVPKRERKRGVWAADELFATMRGLLSDYAQLDDGAKGWDSKYETIIHINDINFVIPGDVRP